MGLASEQIQQRGHWSLILWERLCRFDSMTGHLMNASVSLVYRCTTNRLPQSQPKAFAYPLDSSTSISLCMIWYCCERQCCSLVEPRTFCPVSYWSGLIPSACPSWSLVSSSCFGFPGCHAIGTGPGSPWCTRTRSWSTHLIHYRRLNARSGHRFQGQSEYRLRFPSSQRQECACVACGSLSEGHSAVLQLPWSG